MTAKELVNLIIANFADDEEVTFLYNDDQSEVRATEAKVEMHIATYCNGHYEARIRCTDIWEKVDYKSIHTDEYRQKYFEHRFVNDGTTYTDTKKVIAIQ